MRNMTKISDVVGEGESSSTIPDDPDTPLIIKILPSSLKLSLSIKTEIKEEDEVEVDHHILQSKLSLKSYAIIEIQ